MYTKEQINETLQNALQMVSSCTNNPLNGLESPVFKNYIDLLKQTFVHDTSVYNKVSNLIDGMILLKEYELIKQLERLN